MPQSGTKLVIAILGLALALGAVSWWYRFESAHRATRFWGPEAAELIEEPSEVQGYQLDLARGEQPTDPERLSLSGQHYDIPLQKVLTAAPGMVHLRHALLMDSDYLWMHRPAPPGAWRWMLKFSQGERQVLVLLSDDCEILGKSVDGKSVEPITSQPMATTLLQYFTALGLK